MTPKDNAALDSEAEPSGSSSKHRTDICTIQQRNCETETLRVFRLITSQVFGRLLEESRHVNHGEGGGAIDDGDDWHENYLKEHMVGILFSRSKLTHLQKQVRRQSCRCCV